MVTATIKLAIATERLSDEKEDSEFEPGARRSTHGDEDLQNSSEEVNLDI